MKQLCKYGLLVLLASMLWSCNRDLELPKINAKEKIVLLGEITANDSIYFRAGQSLPVSTNTSTETQVISDLKMTLQDPAGFKINLSSFEDEHTYRLYTIPFTSDYVVQPKSSYIFTAVHPQMGTATAQVYIPGPFTAAITGKEDMVYGGDTVVAFDIRIDDPSGENYYVIEAIKQKMDIQGYFYYDNSWWGISDYKWMYDSLKEVGSVETRYDTTYLRDYIRYYEYTNDMNTENLKDNTSFNSFRRILLTDREFNGTSYNTRVLVSMQNNNAIFGFKGQLILSVKSVSKDYFEYLRAYESYDAVPTFNSSNVPANVSTNVSNGLGILGGVYKRQFTYLVDTWDF